MTALQKVKPSPLPSAALCCAPQVVGWLLACCAYTVLGHTVLPFCFAPNNLCMRAVAHVYGTHLYTPLRTHATPRSYHICVLARRYHNYHWAAVCGCVVTISWWQAEFCVALAICCFIASIKSRPKQLVLVRNSRLDSRQLHLLLSRTMHVTLPLFSTAGLREPHCRESRPGKCAGWSAGRHKDLAHGTRRLGRHGCTRHSYICCCHGQRRQCLDC